MDFFYFIHPFHPFLLSISRRNITRKKYIQKLNCKIKSEEKKLQLFVLRFERTREPVAEGETEVTKKRKSFFYRFKQVEKLKNLNNS